MASVITPAAATNTAKAPNPVPSIVPTSFIISALCAVCGEAVAPQLSVVVDGSCALIVPTIANPPMLPIARRITIKNRLLTCMKHPALTKSP